MCGDSSAVVRRSPASAVLGRIVTVRRCHDLYEGGAVVRLPGEHPDDLEDLT